MTFMMKHNRDHNQNAVWADCVVLIGRKNLPVANIWKMKLGHHSFIGGW